MTFPPHHRNLRRRKTIGEQLSAAFRASPELFSRANAADAHLAALRKAREAAYADTMAAHRRGDTRGYHAALKRLVTATHAVMREERRG